MLTTHPLLNKKSLLLSDRDNPLGQVILARLPDNLIRDIHSCQTPLQLHRWEGILICCYSNKDPGRIVGMVF